MPELGGHRKIGRLPGGRARHGGLPETTKKHKAAGGLMMALCNTGKAVTRHA